MKHLPQYLLEGLFDSYDKLKNNPGALVNELADETRFKDKDSEFWEFLKLQTSSGIPMGPTNIQKAMEDEDNFNINIDTKIITLTGYYDVCIDGKTKNPMAQTYELRCGDFFIGNRTSSGPHPDPMTDGAGFNKIYCSRLTIDDSCRKLDGFNFIIRQNGTRLASFTRINWASDLDMTNSTIDFETNDKLITFEGCWDFPKLGGIESNATRIHIYDPGLFEHNDIKKKLDKFFGDGEIEANGIVKKKNIRNIVAIANNMRKYNSIDPSQIIPVGKVSDLLDLKGFKDVDIIDMGNNNVEIKFFKLSSPLSKEHIIRHARFVRMNNMAKYKDYSVDQMVELVEQCVTKDGWVVTVALKNF